MLNRTKGTKIMNTNVNSITVTIPNPTPKVIAAIAAILNETTDTTVGMTSDTASLAGITKARRGSTKTTNPAKTVSPDEDEDFATEALDEEDLDVTDDEDTDDETDEDEGLDFATVKAAINKYGEKKPNDMKTILSGFNLKSTKELQAKKTKWEPVYRKVMVKLKALKNK